MVESVVVGKCLPKHTDAVYPVGRGGFARVHPGMLAQPKIFSRSPFLRINSTYCAHVSDAAGGSPTG